MFDAVLTAVSVKVKLQFYLPFGHTMAFFVAFGHQRFSQVQLLLLICWWKM